MSMYPQQENFEQLRRLLVLKRHEQPPPGYFNDFSRHVICRIEAAEAAAAQGFLQRVLSRTPWLGRIWDGFEAKPLAAGAFGVGVCSLLVVGLVSSERIDANPAAFVPDSADQPSVVATAVARPAIGYSLFERAAADHGATGEVFAVQNRSIFEEIQKPRVQTINYAPAGN